MSHCWHFEILAEKGVSMYRILVFSLLFFTAAWSFAQSAIGITGVVEWDNQRIGSAVSLDLASAGIRLPAGRLQAEGLLRAGYINLIRPHLLSLQVDSSSTIADLIERGEFSLREIEAIALGANSVPASLSHDMRAISQTHTISISNISSGLIRHSRPAPVMRILNPVSAAQYTGIIIIASQALPVHGMRGTAMPVPCLFPKIWDSDMNIIYERNILEPNNAVMIKYSGMQNILQNNPSGLSPELQEFVGQRPLRIFARGVFGINPTDLIIDRNDALLIISSEENRRLLTQGKVAIILDDSVLRSNFTSE
jgi:hypothetical protein